MGQAIIPFLRKEKAMLLSWNFQKKALYETNPAIHINISMSHPKIHLENDPAVIKGIYPNIFCIEEYSSGYPQCHTLLYADVLTNQIEIVELTHA